MNRSLGSNIIKLLTSRIAAQIIGFVTAPIITRIFLPEHFGSVQLFLSISSTIIVISCLRYEYSIPLGRNTNEVIASVIISILSALLISLASLILVFTLRKNVSIWLKSSDLEVFLLYLPLTIFLGGISHALNYYASYLGIFSAVAWSSFALTLGNVLITIFLGLFLGASSMFLFLGNIAGLILSILVLSIFIFRCKFLLDFSNVDLSIKYIWNTAKHYKKFPIYDTWAGLFNSASMQLPPIILGTYFSTTIVGYYSLGNRLIGLPISLLGHAISQVFFPSAAKEYNEQGKLANLVGKTSKRLIQIGVFPFMILGFLGGPLFGFIFGENWIEAGLYTQILSIYVLFQFISAPLSTVFSIFNRQGTLLFLTLGQLVIRTIALVLFARFGDPINCLIAFSFASSILYITVFYFVYHLSGASLYSGIKIFIKYSFLSIILILPMLILKRIIHSFYLFLAMLFVDTLIYISIIYYVDLEVRKTINSITKKIIKVKQP